MMDQGSLHNWSRMNSMLILQLILLCPAAVAGCNRDVERQLILAKIKAHFLDFLGPVPQNERVQGGRRGLHRRHILDTTATRSSEEEHISQVLSLPIPGVGCQPEHEGMFTYIFQSSSHIENRKVISAQLWFYTGRSNHSFPEPEILMLFKGGHVPLATVAVPDTEGWTVFHFRKPFLRFFPQNVLMLFISCLSCPCVTGAEKRPFLIATIKDKGKPHLKFTANITVGLQHNAVAHHNCHRTAINISFEELGWDNWIVHPKSFMFYYCHGSCSDIHRYIPNFRNCCAALADTKQSLRIRTTSDGGYSFKYETVPNIITQHCVCM